MFSQRQVNRTLFFCIQCFIVDSLRNVVQSLMFTRQGYQTLVMDTSSEERSRSESILIEHILIELVQITENGL